MADGRIHAVRTNRYAKRRHHQRHRLFGLSQRIVDVQFVRIGADENELVERFVVCCGHDVIRQPRQCPRPRGARLRQREGNPADRNFAGPGAGWIGACDVFERTVSGTVASGHNFNPRRPAHGLILARGRGQNRHSAQSAFGDHVSVRQSKTGATWEHRR